MFIKNPISGNQAGQTKEGKTGVTSSPDTVEQNIGRASPNNNRQKLEFISLNLGGPQYADKSSELITYLENLIKLNPDTKADKNIFFFQEATKYHIKDLVKTLFKDDKIRSHILYDENTDSDSEANGHAIIEGDKNWYIVAPDYKKMTPTETKLINSLTGIANFISGKDIKKYSLEDKKTGYSYLMTVIPKNFAKNVSELMVKRNNSQKFLETQTTHFFHHVGKPAMGWGDRKNYVLQVNTPALDTANIHLSTVGTPYRRFLEVFSTALMLKNPEERVPETRTEIVMDLDKAAKAATFRKEPDTKGKAQIIAGDANFFRSAMGNEPGIFTSTIKPLLKWMFGLNTNYPTGNSSFKPTDGKAKHGPEELDITLSNKELLSTKVEEIPKHLTDHDLLRSEIPFESSSKEKQELFLDSDKLTESAA
ncbi:MAG: hypothetical protein HRT47_09305 [Candidatus Caenarcaniphilales bacterium]|nr:hypothetical protein [Candidatus Caenarcaniphilales bacterium]